MTVESALPPVESMARGAVPLAILADYDGTIALTDVCDILSADHATGIWERYAEGYRDGTVGSRRLLELEVSLIRAEPETLLEKAADEPHDPSFAPFVRRAQESGIPVEVVSDGYGFYIEPALERLGVPGLPVISARMTFADGRASIAFPNGHPTCLVCGTCKRQRVLAHQAAGRAVIFIGDGHSDRYAAGHADVVFAKGELEAFCLARGWPFHQWTDFDDIRAWLDEAVDAWRDDPGTPLLPRPTARPFFCGPEVWGEGLSDPPGSLPSDWTEGGS